MSRPRGLERRRLLIGAAAACPRLALAQKAPMTTPITAQATADYLSRLQTGLRDAGGGAFRAATEDGLLPLHNSFRAAHGLAPLQRHPPLDEAARAHTADLLGRRYFAHGSPEGFTAEHRVGLIARRFVGAAGENLALETGVAAPGAAAWAKLWRASPGHRANMLRADYTHVGFGVVTKGERTLAAAVFGQVHGQLAKPAPFRIGAGEGLAGVLQGAEPPLSGYELYPLGGGQALGPFQGEAAPTGLAPGAYAIRPHAPDPRLPYRYWILYGPIVVAGPI